MFRRRQFLQTVGIGGCGALAGCVGSPLSPAEFDPLADRSADETATTQFRGGLHNRGYVDVRVPDSVTVDWSLPVNRGDHTAAKSTPVTATDDGEDLLVAGDTGEVRRVTPDGEPGWTASVESTKRGIHGTPAVANRTAYVGAYDGALYAFDVETGERKWRTAIGDAIGSSPVYYNGVCYIAVEYNDPSGSVAAVDAESGEVRWIDRRPTDHPHSTVGIDREAGRLVVGANDGILYAWSFPDLERVWTFETDGAIKGPIALYDGLAVFGSWDSHVYGVDVEAGEEVWAFEARDDVMSAPAVDPDGTVYAGSHDGNVYALDATDGTERWRFETGGYVIGGLVATPGRVLAGSYDDRMYAIDAETGDETWHTTGRGHATSAVLVREDPAALYYAERADGDVPGRLYRLVAD